MTICLGVHTGEEQRHSRLSEQGEDASPQERRDHIVADDGEQTTPRTCRYNKHFTPAAPPAPVSDIELNRCSSLSRPLNYSEARCSPAATREAFLTPLPPYLRTRFISTLRCSACASSGSNKERLEIARVMAT